MISRTAALAIVALLGGAISGPAGAVAVPASAQSEAVGVRVPVGPAERTQPTAADAADLPDGSLTEVAVVVPGVSAGEVEATPDVTAGRADSDVVVADDVVADRVASDVVETDGFQTLGVTWPEGSDVADLGAQVRVRADGDWSDWIALETDSESPDAGTADAANAALRGGTDPLWVGDADAVQMSFAATAEGGPDDLALVLVESEDVPVAPDDATVGTSASTDMVVQTAVFTQGLAAEALPALHVISRAEWGAAAPVCTPDIATQLVGAAVHHTAGSNDYSTVAQAMQQIRNDQRYHIEGRGWCDLGYNFVVDKWGNIYEGRVDSLVAPVIGVHAGGFNTSTVGVAMLGTYDAAPPAATQQSVAQIIGWRLGAYGVDPDGRMDYYTGAGENSRYANQWVNLPRVFGHRDVAYTACPGNGGQDALPAIRTTARGIASQVAYADAVVRVKALYDDMLGRATDPAGLAFWAAWASLGGPGPVATTLARSIEYVQTRVREAYREILGREVEPGGLAAWTAEITSGRLRQEDLRASLIASDEYFARAGGTTAGYVALLYNDMLGRAASSSELAYWSAIAAGGRARVSSGVWLSLESAQRRVEETYLVFLDRSAEPGGLSAWAPYWIAYGEDALRVGIVSSVEYLDRARRNYS